MSECDVEDWAAASRAQVYYSLGKLRDQELIRPTQSASDETLRERQTWRITPKGRRALTTALSSTHWASLRSVPPFMTWMALSELARPAARQRILDDRRRFLEAEIEREQQTLAQARQLPPENEGVQVTLLMVEHVIERMALELKLLDRLHNHFAS